MKNKLASILLTCLALTSSIPAWAQSEPADSDVLEQDMYAEIWSELNEDEDSALQMDAIEILDTIEAEVRNGARPAFAQTIVLPDVQSVNDWLESANGVYGDQSGKGTRSVMVRGFEPRQLRIDFAGIPLETGYEGLAPIDVLPMNWISAGRIAHADATPTDGVGFGGKLDLYAFDPSLIEAAVEVSRSGMVASLSHGMQYDAWRWAATVGGSYSNGFILSNAFESADGEDGGLRDASEKKSANFLLKAGRSLSDWGDLELMAGWAQAPRDVPTGINTGTHRYWRFSSWRAAFASARLKFQTSPLKGLLLLWATDQGNTLESYDDASRTTQTSLQSSTSVWQDDDYGLKLQLDGTPFDLGSAGHLGLLLRTDFRYQRHAANEDFYAPEANDWSNASRFYFDLRPAIEWLITPDIRVFAAANAVGAVPVSQDASAPEDNEVKLQAMYNGGFSVGLDYSILTNLDLGVRAARRLRMPTLKEQFRNVPEAEGIEIETLNPEVAWDFEVELHYKPIEEVALTIGVFDTEVRDLIDFKYINNIKIAHNISESRIAGTDIALKLGAWAGFSFDLSYHYLYAYDLTEDHELNDRPAHSFRGAVHYSPIENLRFTVGAQFESKRRTEAWMSSKYVWLGNIFLLNAEIEWHIEHFSMYLRGTNLTDYNYSRAVGYPEAGFNIMLGGKVSY